MEDTQALMNMRYASNILVKQELLNSKKNSVFSFQLKNIHIGLRAIAVHHITILGVVAIPSSFPFLSLFIVAK